MIQRFRGGGPAATASTCAARAPTRSTCDRAELQLSTGRREHLDHAASDDASPAVLGRGRPSDGTWPSRSTVGRRARPRVPSSVPPLDDASVRLLRLALHETSGPASTPSCLTCERSTVRPRAARPRRRSRVDTTAPQVNVRGSIRPIRRRPTSSSMPWTRTAVTFECAIGNDELPAVRRHLHDAIAGGRRLRPVRDRHRRGRQQHDHAEVPFKINAVPSGGGGTGPPTPPSVQPRRIIIESLVLISGRTVKMSRRGVVSIGLQCAGTKRCRAA